MSIWQFKCVANGYHAAHSSDDSLDEDEVQELFEFAQRGD